MPENPDDVIRLKPGQQTVITVTLQEILRGHPGRTGSCDPPAGRYSVRLIYGGAVSNAQRFDVLPAP